MTRCLIADDEPHLARALATELATLWPGLELLPPARNGVEAAQRIATLRPEVAFLDIQMPGLTGLEVAQGIEGFHACGVRDGLRRVRGAGLRAAGARLRAQAREGRAPAAHRRARAARHRHAAGRNRQQLLAALQRLMPAAAPPDRLRWVRASSGELTHQVDVQEVLFFRADDKYTCVQTAHAEHLIRTPIAELSAQLDPQQFLQVHRSTIVNLAHLAGTRRDENSRLFLRIKGHAQELPVSRAYVHLFKAM
jgi:DNA-binding LytR/AlgR family response regulator